MTDADVEVPTTEVELLHSVPYAPRKAFKTFHDSNKRWSIIVAHRRAGKTVASINKLIRAAMECPRPDGRYAYIGPLLSQAKDVAWLYLKRYSQALWREPPNEAELRVELVSGATVRLYGSDNPDRLRGTYFDGVVLDEYASQHEEVWGEIVRPALSDRGGWAAFIGTPKGQNAFYELWEKHRDDSEWFRLMVRADTSGIIPHEELEDMQEELSPEEFDQELLCAWTSAVRGAFYAEQLRRMDAEGRICHLDIDRAVRVHTAWDLGRRDATAIWFVQCVGRERRLVDYYEASGAGFDHYANVLQDRRRDRNWVYGDHYFPHDVEVHMLDSRLSRIDTLRNLGIEVTVVKQHAVLDGINAVRRMLDRTWIDPVTCKRGLECLHNYQTEWDQKMKAFKTNPLHNWASHGADALRAFAAGYDDPKVVSHDGSYRRRFKSGGQQTTSWSA